MDIKTSFDEEFTEKAYANYANHLNFHMGKYMPEFQDLDPEEQEAWKRAIDSSIHDVLESLFEEMQMHLNFKL